MKVNTQIYKVAGMWSLMVITAIAQLTDQPVFAQDPPLKEFRIMVQEKTIELLSDPQKQVTVWAFGLEGEEATVPGPVIRVQVGDLVKVHFTNTHTLPHSMHFHGVHPFRMDGTGQRNLGKEQLQMPGESFTYEWVARDPGYYIYHCHFDTPNHMDHGMYGVYIVEDPAWPKVDQEFLTIWDEWDIDGDGQYDTHTINTRSAPEFHSLFAEVGQNVRLVMANLGFEVHTPHVHGQIWNLLDTGNLQNTVATNRNGVISLAPAEVKIVEFTPLYEGTWLFHCHVLPHVADNRKYPRGMLTTLNITSALSAPPAQNQAPEVEKAADFQDSEQSQLASLPPFRPSDYPTTGNADAGITLFTTNCSPCHGPFAQGGFGPKLHGNPILQNHQGFWEIVLFGRGEMPLRKDRLNLQEIADILAWLQTLKRPSPP